MAKLHVKKGDKVLVLSGKDKGKKGKVVSALPDKGKVIVEGVNLVKKHTRPAQRSQGGIIEQEAAIHGSNVMVVCPSCQKSSRVKKAVQKDGSRVRACRKCGESLDK